MVKAGPDLRLPAPVKTSIAFCIPCSRGGAKTGTTPRLKQLYNYHRIRLRVWSLEARVVVELRVIGQTPLSPAQSAIVGLGVQPVVGHGNETTFKTSTSGVFAKSN